MKKINKEKISSTQISIMVFLSIYLSSSLFGAGIMARDGRELSWVIGTLPCVVGIIVLGIIKALWSRFPNLTLPEYCEIIFGKYVGKFVSILYVLFFVVEQVITVRAFSDFMQLSSMRETPTSALSIFILIGSGYIAYKGIETVARVSELIIPMFSMMFVLILTLFIHQLDWGEFFSLYGGDIVSLIHGSMISSSWYGEVIILAFLLPFVKQTEEINKKTILTLLISAAVICFVILMTIASFGINLTAILEIPLQFVFKYIEFGPTIARVDTIVISLWIIGMVMRIAIFYYLLCLSLSTVFNTKTNTVWFIPAGIIIVILVSNMGAVFKVNEIVRNQLGYIRLAFELIIPIFILLVALLKKKGEINVK